MSKAPPEKLKKQMAIVLLVIATLFIARAFFSSGGGGGSAQPAATTAAVKDKDKSAKLEQLDPRLQLDLLGNSEDVKYEGRGKNIFSGELEAVVIPPVIKSPLQKKRDDAAAAEAAAAAAVAAEYERKHPRPLPPPPINLKYFGLSNGKGEKPKAFLSQGDDIWVAHEGDVVNRQYRILRISPSAVEVEDLLNNNRQSIRLTENAG